MQVHPLHPLDAYVYTVFQKKTAPFVISSYLCFDSYKLHEIADVACCEY